MAEDKNRAERFGGEYMIQDRDHMGDMGQMGGETRQGGARQSEQSQAGDRQQGGGQQSGGQQGGEQNRTASYRRSKLL